MDIWYLKYVIAYILLLTMLVIGLIYRIIVLIYRSIQAQKNVVCNNALALFAM
ncbi:ASFV G ACD 01940 [African swine fever virus]|uniref:ASFV G ACD 01940 CDS protein n=1 Tax=African swine fever virus TaxID=10497 RepID=A0A2X0S7I3_ASF|nr:hypothetical protein IM014_gp194 [African swine fever virus]AYW34128.1 ASFV_G_ACD_01940 [African swine fever virus]QBH90646.1 ASFV_G_ACD_01940 [African swine fever virus]QBH90831.1 ASFV_G_ACD_01940 [African swine fever virus]QDL88189.1 ASFV_Ch_ACD_01940 [African swine fever virus]QED90601.1 ASFV_G_ACD_01940 [African swine fever virus]